MALLLCAILGLSAAGYWVFLKNNIEPNDKRPSINIPTGATYKDVIALLLENEIVQNIVSFKVAAQFKHYQTVKPGHYVFTKVMNNREIVNMLQSGNQVPVKLVVYNILTKAAFAGLVGRTLEIDSTEFLATLNDSSFCARYDLDTNTILCRFIADNYELKWNTAIDALILRMNEGYEQFWNGKRKQQAESIGYSIADITTLASIVEKECMYDKELPTVAGVYLNRLKINMPLQADPTLKFAMHDFDAHRVTNKHKSYDSPYNTYLHSGLPPGPICMPKKKVIDAVLNAEQHDYIYFCANPDMSGYSIFSKTLDEQNRVATAYRKKLDEMKVH